MQCPPNGAAERMVIKASAKLNLTLEVGPRQQDGYHPIASVMVPLSLVDEIELEIAPAGSFQLDVEVAESVGEMIDGGESNLAWRAAELLCREGEERGLKPAGVHMRLVKRIPVAAGLGGGSADAAAVLVGLNRLWGWPFDSGELAHIGARLGADIPFCVHSRPALVEGIGDRCTLLSGIPSLPIVLVNLRRPLTAGEVYQSFDELGGPERRPGRRTVEMIQALHSGDFGQIASALYNDLEPAAQRLLPDIAAVQDTMRDAGALGCLVAGSGPTVFGLAADRAHADAIAAACRQKADASGSAWWIWAGWGGADAFGKRIATDQPRQLQAVAGACVRGHSGGDYPGSAEAGGTANGDAVG